MNITHFMVEDLPDRGLQSQNREFMDNAGTFEQVDIFYMTRREYAEESREYAVNLQVSVACSQRSHQGNGPCSEVP